MSATVASNAVNLAVVAINLASDAVNLAVVAARPALVSDRPALVSDRPALVSDRSDLNVAIAASSAASRAANKGHIAQGLLGGMRDIFARFAALACMKALFCPCKALHFMSGGPTAPEAVQDAFLSTFNQFMDATTTELVCLREENDRLQAELAAAKAQIAAFAPMQANIAAREQKWKADVVQYKASLRRSSEALAVAADEVTAARTVSTKAAGGESAPENGTDAHCGSDDTATDAVAQHSLWRNGNAPGNRASKRRKPTIATP